MFVCRYVCMYVFICMYVYVYVFIYIYMCPVSWFGCLCLLIIAVQILRYCICPFRVVDIHAHIQWLIRWYSMHTSVFTTSVSVSAFMISSTKINLRTNMSMVSGMFCFPSQKIWHEIHWTAIDFQTQWIYVCFHSKTLISSCETRLWFSIRWRFISQRLSHFYWILGWGLALRPRVWIVLFQSRDYEVKKHCRQL